MRFTWNDREFEGPKVSRGLLGGFTVGEIRWAKKELKVSAAEDFDAVEAEILYHVLSIRRADHRLLPISQFGDLSLLDFMPVPHVINPDESGDCMDCGRPPQAPVHTEAPEVPTGQDEPIETAGRDLGDQ